MLLVQVPVAVWAGPGARAGAAVAAVGVRHGLAGLGDARRRLRWAERVESEDAFDLGRHRGVHLGSRRVVVAGLARGQAVLRDRRREGGLDLRHRARHGQRQPGGRWRPDRQALLPGALTVTCATVAGVGPKRCANCVGVKKWRYSGEPGSETACTSAANAAGSRGFSVTMSGSGVVAGAGPMRVAPGGTRPWCPGSFTRPDPPRAGARRGRRRRRPPCNASRRARPSEDREATRLQPTAATSIDVHLCVLHSCPPGGVRLMPLTRAVGRAQGPSRRDLQRAFAAVVGTAPDRLDAVRPWQTAQPELRLKPVDVQWPGGLPTRFAARVVPDEPRVAE